MPTEKTNDATPQAKRRSYPQFALSSWVDEGAAERGREISDLSWRVSRAVACLREWQALEYTGHFIDCHPEQKERIASVARRTDDVLREWNASIKPEPSST